LPQKLKKRLESKLLAKEDGTLVLTRPALFELGSEIPLTLVFDSTALNAVTVDGITCPLRKVNGKTYVNVPHAKTETVPTVIGKADENGLCKKIPGVTSVVRLDRNTDAITVTIVNETTEALKDVTLTAALPPAYTPGIIRWQRPTLSTGETWTVTTKLVQEHEGDY
jgi:hypothetical protein